MTTTVEVSRSLSAWPSNLPSQLHTTPPSRSAGRRVRVAPKRLRQSGLRRPEDLQDRPPVLGGEVGEVGGLVLPGQDLTEAAVDVIPGRRGQGIEGLAVDKIAARIGE